MRLHLKDDKEAGDFAKLLLEIGNGLYPKSTN